MSPLVVFLVTLIGTGSALVAFDLTSPRRIADRWWLFRHSVGPGRSRRHRAGNLVGDVWSCSCGARRDVVDRWGNA